MGSQTKAFLLPILALAFLGGVLAFDGCTAGVKTAEKEEGPTLVPPIQPGEQVDLLERPWEAISDADYDFPVGKVENVPEGLRLDYSGGPGGEKGYILVQFPFDEYPRFEDYKLVIRYRDVTGGVNPPQGLSHRSGLFFTMLPVRTDGGPEDPNNPPIRIPLVDRFDEEIEINLAELAQGFERFKLISLNFGREAYGFSPLNPPGTRIELVKAALVPKEAAPASTRQPGGGSEKSGSGDSAAAADGYVVSGRTPDQYDVIGPDGVQDEDTSGRLAATRDLLREDSEDETAPSENVYKASILTH